MFKDGQFGAAKGLFRRIRETDAIVVLGCAGRVRDDSHAPSGSGKNFCAFGYDDMNLSHYLAWNDASTLMGPIKCRLKSASSSAGIQYS
jgi:hypothetical protein